MHESPEVNVVCGSNFIAINRKLMDVIAVGP